VPNMVPLMDILSVSAKGIQQFRIDL